MKKDIKSKDSNKMPKCDVIIPIYNAYDCLEECIDSVISNTDLVNNNLILIDDASTDERVWDLLKTYKKKYPKFEIIQNKENLGFVKTVNKGMKLSKNDVLLLNSDTIVTPRWLEKIKECAYSQEMVATVTPLSNNATLASVPNIFEENKLPKDLSLNEMSKIVEECSYNDYPEIPTAHGFCMYIKRSVLEEVGYFDEEAFGKGYGEENDFCFRCFDVGYRHLLCDNTYIYHKESQSFSKLKYELRENGAKVLNERYPGYWYRLHDWNSKRPITYIGQNVAFELGARKPKANILFLIHDWKNVKENVGGTTLHAYDLMLGLRDKYNFHVLAPEDGIYKLYSYWSETETVIKFPGVTNFKDLNFYNSDYRDMVSKIIKDFGISLVHIHHMKGHFFDIVDLIKEFNLYSIFSVHDYYSVCPMINKIYKGEKYCGNPTEEMCGECIKYCMGIKNNVIFNWRKTWMKLFNEVDKVIAPSESAKEELNITYKDLSIDVIEHGVDLKKNTSTLSIKKEETKDIAFVGVISQHKGGRYLEYLAKKARLKNIRVHLFGRSDIALKDTKYFKNHGGYKRAELCSLLQENKIKLVCFFSTGPETYAYTLTESIACGVPALSTDLGATGERIKKYNLGWVINPNSELVDYKNKIIEILSNPSEYEKVIESINKYKVKTTKQMVKEYDQLYSNSSFDNLCDVTNIRDNLKYSSLYFSITSSPTYPDYSWVFNTLKWKIIDKFKIPKPIKEMYRKVRSKIS